MTTTFFGQYLLENLQRLERFLKKTENNNNNNKTKTKQKAKNKTKQNKKTQQQQNKTKWFGGQRCTDLL